MKNNVMKKILAVAVLGASCTNSHAAGFYAGIDGGMTTYPSYAQDLANWLVSPGGGGGTYANVTQYPTGSTFGIHAGQWIVDQFGWEIGYTDLGSVDGTVSTNAPGYTNEKYTYSATAAHVAVLGGVPLGRGKLFGKAGLYSAKTTLKDNCQFCTPSQSASNVGLLIGAGYEHWFTEKFSLRAGVNVYSGVKFVNVSTYTPDNQTMVQASVGVNFTF